MTTTTTTTKRFTKLRLESQMRILVKIGLKTENHESCVFLSPQKPGAWGADHTEEQSGVSSTTVGVECGVWRVHIIVEKSH
jgi:hypothetical protein